MYINSGEACVSTQLDYTFLSDFCRTRLPFNMTETTVNNDKHGLWIRDQLIPLVVEKQQAASPTKKISLKDSSFKKFTNDGGYIITLCYKVIIVLDVDGGERTISFFVKVYSVKVSSVVCGATDI